jgi:putative DNA primase/helicase
MSAAWSSFGEDSPASPAPWAPLVPLPGELPPVDDYDPELLPPTLRRAAVDIAHRLQVAVVVVAVAMWIAVAAAVGRRAVIQPKQLDTEWIVVPNLWGLIIAESGTKKTSIMRAAFGPLLGYQDIRWQEYLLAKDQYRRDREMFDLELGIWKEEYKKSKRNNQPPPARPENEPQEPRPWYAVTNDMTWPAMQQALEVNPGGISLFRDEIHGWLCLLERKEYREDRSFFLTGWNGNESYSVGRISRDHVHAAAVCISILGGIQPDPLRAYLSDARRAVGGDDGFPARFQLGVWADLPPYERVDRQPDRGALDSYRQLIHRLLEMTVEDPLRRLRFDPGAQRLFDDWHDHNQRRVREDRTLHPAARSHLAKYPSLMPTLALLGELVDRVGFGNLQGSDLVSAENARRAIANCTCLESHMGRMYSCLLNPQLQAACDLAAKIREHAVQLNSNGFFTIAEIYVNCWSGLDTREKVEKALKVLEDLNWVRWRPRPAGPSGGQPTIEYEVNPEVWES